MSKRLSLPPYVSRQLAILSAHREIAPEIIVYELIAREYATLGLEEPEFSWKSPEAAK